MKKHILPILLVLLMILLAGCSKPSEDVYVRFNQHHPRGYKARSLSKSDIVEIIGKDGTSEFHYCDSFGFKKVDFEPEKAKLSERYLDLSKGETVMFQSHRTT